MQNFVVGIPTYKRSDRQLTLQYVREQGLKAQDVYLFVQSEEEALAYAKYENEAVVVLKPAHWIAQARNNVLDYFGPDVNVLMMDDDVKGIMKLAGDHLEKVDFMQEMSDAFERAAGRPLFGVYPVDNAYFMSESISTKVTVNTVLGFPAGPRMRFNDQFRAKEDLELCARILSLGGRVLRFNNLAVSALHRTNRGGCYDTWKTTANGTAARRLQLMYPGIIKQRRDNPDEIRVVMRDEKIDLRNSKL